MFKRIITIFIVLFYHRTSLKNTYLPTRGLHPSPLASLNRHASHSTITYQQNKDASSPGLNSTVSPIRPNINSHVVTDSIFVMQSILLLP